MTTFNMRNQSKRHRYLTCSFSAIICLLIFVAVVLIVQPSFLKHELSLLRGENISQVNVISELKQENLTETTPPPTTTPVIETTTQDKEHIVIQTKLGKIRGRLSNELGVDLSTFLGIPYAKPPQGKFRFKRTVPLSPWEDTMNALELPSPCYQPLYTQKLFPVKILNYNISEDCLYLNIWAPVNHEEPLPVLIFIHGGMFTVGSIGLDEYDGKILAAYGNAVVVTIQYRLGIFGFLDLNTTTIPGNQGLWDQAMAIKWVHENIDNFGGDPNLITLFGQSAGAISIGLHMISNFSKNLFKRVIMQSGSPMLLNPVYTKGEEVSEMFAEKVGCLSEGVMLEEAYELVSKCVHNLPLQKIVDVQQEMVKNNPVPFMPTIPTEYVDTFPTQAINDYYNETEIKQKDFLLGFNLNDGNLILHLAYPELYSRFQVPNITTLEQARESMTMMSVDGGFPETQAKAMASVFLHGNQSDTPENFANKMGSALGDLMFVCPTMKLSDKLFKLGKNVYMYLFSHRAYNSVWGKWMGVTHHDEINLVFGLPLRYPNLYHGDDIDLSKRIMKTWTYFAKTG